MRLGDGMVVLFYFWQGVKRVLVGLGIVTIPGKCSTQSYTLAFRVRVLEVLI